MSCCEPLFRRAGVGASRPQIRSGGSLRADRPPRVRNAFRRPRLKMMRTVPRRASASGRLRSVAAVARRSVRHSRLVEEALGIASMNLRSDRGQPAGRQLRLALSGAAGLHGPSDPRHRVAVVSDHGEPLPPGETGIIAAKRPDQSCSRLLEQSEATAQIRWRLAADGDVALQDDAGYICTRGARRSDLQRRYRIGSVPTTECLMSTRPCLIRPMSAPDRCDSRRWRSDRLAPLYRCSRRHPAARHRGQQPIARNFAAVLGMFQ